MTYKIQIDDELRDATANEIARIETSRAEDLALQAEAEARAQAKAQVLAQLGITEEQAKLLLS